MFELELFLFIATSLVIILTPGQDMVLVMTRSIAQGAKAGISTAAGISFGLLGHTLLAAIGLGAILQASETLFLIIKIIGALYLLYLGYQLLTSRPAQLAQSEVSNHSMKKLFVQGALSNLANPKIAIFYFAYLPQFVPAGSANPSVVMFALGALFALLTFFVKAPIGYSAGSFSNWLRARQAVQLWINRVSGTVLVALGLRLALEERS